jgi:hypothetical protein
MGDTIYTTTLYFPRGFPGGFKQILASEWENLSTLALRVP